MERSVAIKKLGKLLGKQMAYRVDPKAPTPEERAAAREQLKAACAERDKLVEQLEARRKAILEVDAEYQSLKAARELAGKKVDKLGWIARHYKITVGTLNSLFFSVRAEGDSWEQVIAKIEGERQAA